MTRGSFGISIVLPLSFAVACPDFGSTLILVCLWPGIFILACCSSHSCHCLMVWSFRGEKRRKKGIGPNQISMLEKPPRGWCLRRRPTSKAILLESSWSFHLGVFQPCFPLVVGRAERIRVPEICLIKCLRCFETLKHHSLKGINHLLSQGERSLAPPLKTKMVPSV